MSIEPKIKSHQGQFASTLAYPPSHQTKSQTSFVTKKRRLKHRNLHELVNFNRIPNIPLGIQDPLNTFLLSLLPNPVYTPITARSLRSEEPVCCRCPLRYPWLLANDNSISASTILLSRSLINNIHINPLQNNIIKTSVGKYQI